MARETFEDWIPIENADKAIQALNRGSATERLARAEPMGSDTKWVPRSGTFAVSSIAKGGSYTETSGTNDYVELLARKVGGAVRIAEEDLVDGPVDIISTKKVDAARNLGYFFDNATLGTSAAANGTTVPFDSVYKAVRTTDTNISYTADANYIGGDINGGVQDLGQLFHRPTSMWHPYATPMPRLFLCSSSTPPGGGVHGLCGYFAAEAAWKFLGSRA